MSAPQAIVDLIARFDEQLASYKSGVYNETQLRREFLDPFFKLLGWDIDNTAGYAEAYKDVIHEDAIRVGDQHKAPDYCFRIGGTRKFFLEAKKPAVYIKEEIPPAYLNRFSSKPRSLPLGKRFRWKQLISLAVAQSVGIWSNESYVALRARNASREKFLEALKEVPDVDPPDYDRLPEGYKRT